MSNGDGHQVNIHRKSRKAFTYVHVWVEGGTRTGWWGTIGGGVRGGTKTRGGGASAHSKKNHLHGNSKPGFQSIKGCTHAAAHTEGRNKWTNSRFRIMPGNPIYPPLSPLTSRSLSLSLRAPSVSVTSSTVPWATTYPVVSACTPTYTLHRLQPRPTASTPAASPLSMRRGTHSSSAAHTATRATPQPYFFHSVLSIDQVLNFRVHPSRASTSSSSASSSASASSYCLLCSTRTCTRYSYAYAPMYVRAHTQTHTHTHPHAHYQSLRCPLPPLIHPYDHSLSLSLLPYFPPSLPPAPWFDPHPGCPSSLFN